MKYEVVHIVVNKYYDTVLSKYYDTVITTFCTQD